jgi:hypothetical protein
MKKEKLIEALYEAYRRAYKVSTPSADFDYLMNNAETDDNGAKVIPYMEYECEDDIMSQILDDVIKEYKIKDIWDQKAVRISFWLGCSPKTKSNQTNN